MSDKSLVRLWWGEKGRKDHRGKSGAGSSRQLMETTLHYVMQDKYLSPFVTYVCGKDNYDYLRAEGLDDIVLVTNSPTLDIPSGIDTQHRLYLCDIALRDFDEIACINWDCRPIAPFKDSVWTQLQSKESIQAALVCSKRRKAYKTPMVKTRGNEGHFFSLDGFLYLRDHSIPKEILRLLDDPDVPNKWTPEALITTYIDQLHGRWIGKDKYYDLHEPECFHGGRIAVWKHETKKDIKFGFQRYYKTKRDVTVK